MNIDEWAANVVGRYIDRDGFPPDNPYQCHDIWLDYLNRVLGGSVSNPNLGWAPTGFTDSVWKQFPAVNGVQNYVSKFGPSDIRKGDVVFWNYGSRTYPLSHVAVAMGSPSGGMVECVTQNPGATARQRLTLDGCIGVLRPVNPQPVVEDMEIEEMFIANVKGSWFLVVPNGAGKPRAVVLGGDSGANTAGLPVLVFTWQPSIDALKLAVDGIS
jgi:hypothetical protein